MNPIICARSWSSRFFGMVPWIGSVPWWCCWYSFIYLVMEAFSGSSRAAGLPGSQPSSVYRHSVWDWDWWSPWSPSWSEEGLSDSAVGDRLVWSAGDSALRFASSGSFKIALLTAQFTWDDYKLVALDWLVILSIFYNWLCFNCCNKNPNIRSQIYKYNA